MSETNVHQEECERCPICLDDLQHDFCHYFSNCTHKVCNMCFEPYILSSNLCPVCREPIEKEEDIVREELEKLISSLEDAKLSFQRLKTANSKHFFSLQNCPDDIKEMRLNADKNLLKVLQDGITMGICPDGSDSSESQHQQPMNLRFEVRSISRPLPLLPTSRTIPNTVSTETRQGTQRMQNPSISLQNQSSNMQNRPFFDIIRQRFNQR